MALPIWISYTNISEFLTLQENIDKPLNEISYAYVGHGQSNMCNALMSGAAKWVWTLDLSVLNKLASWSIL